MSWPSLTRPAQATRSSLLWSLITGLPRAARPLGLIASGSSLSIRPRSEEHTSELQSRFDLVCRLLLEKKKKKILFIGRDRLGDPQVVTLSLCNALDFLAI